MSKSDDRIAALENDLSLREELIPLRTIFLDQWKTAYERGDYPLPPPSPESPMPKKKPTLSPVTIRHYGHSTHSGGKPRPQQ